MSVAPGMKIKKYLGIVDVHTISVVKFLGQAEQVPIIIEKIIEETPAVKFSSFFKIKEYSSKFIYF